LAIEGADRIELAPDGDLVLHTALGEIRQHKPIVYQGERDAPEPVDGHYRLIAHDGRTEVRFELGAYDRERALVLDPTLDFATYFGGAQADFINAAAADADGNIYVGGNTQSDATTFPETAGAYQTAKKAFTDQFVAKIDAAGTQLVYATYIGGDSNDFGGAFGGGLAVDANGQAVLVGNTTSANFPAASAAQGSLCGGTCGTVTKLNAAGNGLVFSTYFGGNRTTEPRAVAVDAALATFVTGVFSSTGSATSTFPTTASAFQSTPTQGTFKSDAFVAKFSTNGTVTYATMLGGGTEFGNSIAVDAGGSTYLIGTMSVASINAFASTAIGPGGNGDVMIAKLNPTGTGLTYLTRVGGSGVEEGTSGALDANNNVFFTGRSFNGPGPSDLPSTPAAPLNNNVALFGALNAAGTALTGPGLTWYGDTSAGTVSCPFQGTKGTSIALDPTTDAAWIAGTGCPVNKFPVLNPIAGLTCSPSCNADTNRINSFLLRYTYGAPEKAPPDATGDPEPNKGTTAPPSIFSASPISAQSMTEAYLSTVISGFYEGSAIFAGYTDGSLPTPDAIDSGANGGYDGYLGKIVNGLPPEISKVFEPASIFCRRYELARDHGTQSKSEHLPHPRLHRRSAARRDQGDLERRQEGRHSFRHPGRLQRHAQSHHGRLCRPWPDRQRLRDRFAIRRELPLRRHAAAELRSLHRTLRGVRR
jgi:hypothetical protein